VGGEDRLLVERSRQRGTSSAQTSIANRHYKKTNGISNEYLLPLIHGGGPEGR
jgi:hypothetical protein